jgi:hypothetical protein
MVEILKTNHDLRNRNEKNYIKIFRSRKVE